MQAQSSPGNNHKTFLVYVIAFVAFVISFASSAKASTTWTITVDVKTPKGNDPPNYVFTSVPPNAPNCSGPSSPPLSLGDLYVCAGDTVNWTPLSSGGKGWLTIHQKQGFRPGANTQPVWLRGREKGTQATVTTLANDYGSIYEYCVAVHDEKGSPTRLYTHDPKIMIGGTPLMVLIEDLQVDCAKLPAAIDHDANENEDLKKQLRDQAARACEQIKKLKELLPSGPPR